MSPLLKWQNQHYIAPTSPPGSPPLVGAGGTMEFTFIAQSSGTAQLKLAYQRPWEKTTPAVTTFAVHYSHSSLDAVLHAWHTRLAFCPR